MGEIGEGLPQTINEDAPAVTAEMTPEELAIREALAAQEAREKAERLYLQGRSDYCSNHRDTEAAQIYIDYWANRL